MEAGEDSGEEYAADDEADQGAGDAVGQARGGQEVDEGAQDVAEDYGDYQESDEQGQETEDGLDVFVVRNETEKVAQRPETRLEIASPTNIATRGRIIWVRPVRNPQKAVRPKLASTSASMQFI